MTGRAVTSQRGPWSKHYREFWEKQALTTNPSIPLAVRVFSLAYGRHKANGHTPFGAGDLRRTLVKSRAAVNARPILYSHKAIAQAVRLAATLGYLDAQSSVRCLIVPQGEIQYLQGDLVEICAVCMPQKVEPVVPPNGTCS